MPATPTAAVSVSDWITTATMPVITPTIPTATLITIPIIITLTPPTTTLTTTLTYTPIPTFRWALDFTEGFMVTLYGAVGEAAVGLSGDRNTCWGGDDDLKE